MIIALALLLASSDPAAAATGTRCSAVGTHKPEALKYICDSARAWADSVASGDSSVIQRILAEDFMGIDPKGRRYRKADMVRDTASAPKYFLSNQINDVIVRFYGNVAVAHGSESWERRSGERGKFVWTDTWLKRDGRWSIIAAQDLIVAESKPK